MCYLLNLLVLTFLYNINVNKNKYVKKRNYFVFVIHKVNKHGVSSRICFAESDTKNFKIGALRTITNITRSTLNWKKEFLYRCISRILFIYTEQFSKIKIS